MRQARQQIRHGVRVEGGVPRTVECEHDRKTELRDLKIGDEATRCLRSDMADKHDAHGDADGEISSHRHVAALHDAADANGPLAEFMDRVTESGEHLADLPQACRGLGQSALAPAHGFGELRPGILLHHFLHWNDAILNKGTEPRPSDRLRSFDLRTASSGDRGSPGCGTDPTSTSSVS